MTKKRQRSRSGGRPGGPGTNGRNRRRRHITNGERPPAMEREVTEDNDAPLEPGTGLLEMHPNGYGFLRNPKNNYSRELTDPFVPGSMIEKYGLREGVMISGMVQPARSSKGRGCGRSSTSTACRPTSTRTSRPSTS